MRKRAPRNLRELILSLDIRKFLVRYSTFWESNNEYRTRNFSNVESTSADSWFLIQWQRGGARRRRAFAGANVSRSEVLVLGGRQSFQLRLAARHSLLVQLLQERNAPATARAGATALRQLTRHLRPVHPDEVDQLPARHVKAITDLGVGVHSAHCKREGELAKGKVDGLL